MNLALWIPLAALLGTAIFTACTWTPPDEPCCKAWAPFRAVRHLVTDWADRHFTWRWMLARDRAAARSYRPSPLGIPRVVEHDQVELTSEQVRAFEEIASGYREQAKEATNRKAGK